MYFSEILSGGFSVIQNKSSGQIREKIYATQVVRSLSLEWQRLNYEVFFEAEVQNRFITD